MDTAPEVPLPRPLRALQRLVLTLLVVMIVGFLLLIGVLVMRLRAEGPPLPPALALPEGAAPVAFTQGGDWFAVVARDAQGAESILVYDRLTLRLRQTVRIEAAAEG